MRYGRLVVAVLSVGVAVVRPAPGRTAAVPTETTCAAIAVSEDAVNRSGFPGGRTIVDMLQEVPGLDLGVQAATPILWRPGVRVLPRPTKSLKSRR
jgi:hypothetical protein